MTVDASTVACVTLTLFARRVIVGSENDLNAQPALYGQGYFFAERDGTNDEFPIKVQRRLDAGSPKGVVVEEHGISVDQAKRLIEELTEAVAQSGQGGKGA